MSNKNVSPNTGGIGFCGLLTLAFIILKLTHVIDWSWWWIMAPLWIPAAFAGVVCIVALAIYVILKRK